MNDAVEGSICLLPHMRGVGGPSSFRGRLAAGLQARGYEVHSDPLDPSCRSMLVIGGTRRLDRVWRARRRGVRVVQRLNGMNWLHRKIKTGWKHYLRSEINNWLLTTIRGSLADAVVYQSQFARTWWQTVHGATSAPGQVIYNGVDLNVFSPQGAGARPTDFYRVLMVEGHLAGGYEQGLEAGVQLVRELNRFMPLPVRLTVAGDVADGLRARWQQVAGEVIEWKGVVPGAEIPILDRSAHLLFSADLNAACPNAVIEALACGLPVVAFSTGSLPELIDGDAGRVVPYGSNYWNLEKPDVATLAAAASQILMDQEVFRVAARARAKAVFGLDVMVEKYLAAIRGQ
ncbi:MAG TPA: glycosyltransferase family 4 protein [Anaerolineales bacterium]